MIFSIIAAVAQNGVIGSKNRLPWHLPNDLKYFKQKTLHHTVIMGRLSFESLGKPLPLRRNIILTTQKNFVALGCEIAHSLDDIFKLTQDEKQEIFILGGAKVYQLFLKLPQTQNLYITHVLASVEGDVFFPPINWHNWKVQNEIFYPKDNRNLYDILIKEYKRL
ncbi:MAG: dihydrofolate reductase [Bacteroidia bacterium]|nr:dihydrofolate reductase [Bacteroidia bacterium]MDW8158338.1 dihydrofolate reductase [Bacteroidia bacterium]